MNCPYCEFAMYPPEYVDVGVGVPMQVTAWGCDYCHAVEVGPYDKVERELNPWEKDKGFYEPDESLFL